MGNIFAFYPENFVAVVEVEVYPEQGKFLRQDLQELDRFVSLLDICFENFHHILKARAPAAIPGGANTAI